jgi:hypothetical protein
MGDNWDGHGGIPLFIKVLKIQKDNFRGNKY